MSKRLFRIVVVVLCVGTGLGVTLSGVVGSAPASAKANAAHSLGSRASRDARVSDYPTGGWEGDTLWGDVINLSPYTLTLVKTWSSIDPTCDCRANVWMQPPAATVAPGQYVRYHLHADHENHDWPYWDLNSYDGWFTYKANVLGAAHPEYLTVAISGCDPGTCHWPDGVNPNPWSHPFHVRVFNTTTVPDDGFDPRWSCPTDDPAQCPGPAPNTSNPQILWTQTDGQGSDVQFQVHGSYTVDAAKDPPQLADVLNAMCARAAGTTCSFTAAPGSALTWGVGAKTEQAEAASCVLSPNGPEVTGTSAPPPENDPDWHEYTVEASRTASLSVGGSISASTETELLGIIGFEVEAKFGAEHEWSNTSTFEKTTRIYVPDDYIASIWIAPVVGKVTGTLVVSTTDQQGNPLATYTITNFTEIRSGAAKSLTTPAFDIMTTARPMTDAEHQQFCPAGAKSARSFRWLPVRSR